MEENRCLKCHERLPGKLERETPQGHRRKRSRYGKGPLRGKCVGGETDYGGNDIIVLLSWNKNCEF